MSSSMIINSPDRLYLLAHQNICISGVNFADKSLDGYVELHFIPLKLTISRVKLNAKQCQIVRLLAKGCHDYFPCTFTYNDPLLEVVPNEVAADGENSPVVEKTLKKFNSKHQDAVHSTDMDSGNGEIIVQLPPEVQKDVSNGSTFKLFVEYHIRNPQGGIQFVIPSDEEFTPQPPEIDLKSMPHEPEGKPAEGETKETTTNGAPPENSETNGKSGNEREDADDDDDDEDEDEDKSSRGPTSKTRRGSSSPDKENKVVKKHSYAHLFSYKTHNSSRLWFPCIDSFNHPCTWIIEITVESHLTAVSCGNLIATYSSQDRRQKTFKYELNIPTAAPNIGFVVGQFDTWIEPGSSNSPCPIKNYFPKGLDKLAKASCAFLTDCAEFYEEFLMFKNPYSSYRQVFVDQAFEVHQSYATLSICCTNLLHSKHIIDQTFVTRSALSEALAAQYFGCFISMCSWPAAWLTRGISSFISAQYERKVFGNNEYRFKVQQAMKQLIEYEQKSGGIVLDETSEVINKSKNNFHFSTQSPHTTSPFFDEAHKLKSFLVIRMLEDRIGRLLLIQVFNKILSLASNASQQRASMNLWSNMLLSTTTFEKAVFTVTGKDKEIASFLEHWIFQGGHAKFNGSFIFDRKRNVVELQIRQPETTSVGIRPYFGPITVTVQELDGTFPQKLNIEENKTTPFVITCHSKSRRNKKKKIPLCTGEEVDMDLSMMDNQDSPVLWIRIDPDMQILRQVVFEQPDYQWQYQLKYERDVTAQLDALGIITNYPTIPTRKILADIIEDEKCYYRVRCSAAQCMTKVANDMAITTTTGGWQAPASMINTYKRLFGSQSCPHIIKLNNFSATNLQSYFLQKVIPKALAGLRLPPHRICPPEVLKFILDLLKYNDNSKNTFSDNYYRAALIEALAETVTPIVSLHNSQLQATTYEQLSRDVKVDVIDEVNRCLNLEKILPCYKHVVTISCLKAISRLQRMGYLPQHPDIFRCYTSSGLFIDVRRAAVEELVDIIRAENKADDLQFLIDLVENDDIPSFKYFILSELHRNPPSIHAFPNYANIREQIWTLMNTKFAHNSKLRCATADVFYKLFGRSDRSSLSSSFGGDSSTKQKKKKKKKDKDRNKEKHKDKKDKKLKKKLRLMEDSSQMGGLGSSGPSGNVFMPPQTSDTTS